MVVVKLMVVVVMMRGGYGESSYGIGDECGNRSGCSNDSDGYVGSDGNSDAD